MRVAVAFDHRGVRLRAAVFQALATHEIVDLGTDAADPPVDYPDKARDIAEAIKEGDAERGVLVCDSGVGASVAANKVAGVRASICHDVYSAHQGVEHDNMNVLCLGSEIVGPMLARELIGAFVRARFNTEEPRYTRRLEKIEQMEREMIRQ